jgi:Ca-activated chloride channel family protein
MDFSNPHFEKPAWLLLAVAGPVLLFLLHRFSETKRRRQLAQLASPRFTQELTLSHSPFRRHLKHLLLLTAVACVGLALARPQWGELESNNQWAGEDVVFVLDSSNSMLAADVLPNRLQRSKLAILNFVRQHGRGRVGLVAFAGSAFLQCPLTLDYDAFERALQSVDENVIPVPGTDIGAALIEAHRGMDKESRRKLIVLVTDGEDLEKDGLKTATSLATNGVVVFTIGVGSPAGTEIQVPNQFGQSEPLRDSKGEVVRSRLDEEMLTSVAKATRGDYYPLGARGEGLMKVRSAIGVLDKSRDTARTRGVDRYYIPIGAVLLCMVLESLIGTRRRI